MVYSLLLFALTAVIAYFHYIQGMFSATISAILAGIAAVIALGTYEQAAPLLFQIKFFDQAASISLVVIFAAVYILPRLLFDKFIPGNVRLPVLADKIGAGVMGLIVGLLSTGVVAVAADALPFGPTLAMYSRFETTDKGNLQYRGAQGQNQDTKTFDVMTGQKLDPDEPTKSHLWLGQDDFVVNLIKHVSAEGAGFSADHSFESIHPDLLDELYGQRLGIQPGAKHSAVSTDGSVGLKAIYMTNKPIPQVDGEETTMRGGDTPPSPTLVADAEQVVLIARMTFAGKAIADEGDSVLRFSAGSLRLMAGLPENNAPYKNYHPVAILDPKGVAVACRPDDFLFSDVSSGTRTIDFIFVVDRDHVMGGDETKAPFHMPQGSFIEFKRYSVIDLSGKTVDPGPSTSNGDKNGLIRKPAVTPSIDRADSLWASGGGAGPVAGGSIASGGTGAAGGTSSSSGGTGATASNGGGDTQQAAGTPQTGAGKLGDSGLSFVEISTSNKLAVPINSGTGNDQATVQLPTGVGGELQGRKWSRLTVSTDTPVKTLGTPVDDNIQELAVEPNHVLVQVECTAPVSGGSKAIWAWGDRVSDFALADATGQTYKCVGAWVTVQRSSEHYIIVNYKNFDDKNHLQGIMPDKGRPIQVWLAFEVPSGTPISEIRLSATMVKGDLNFKAQ